MCRLSKYEWGVSVLIYFTVPVVTVQSEGLQLAGVALYSILGEKVTVCSRSQLLCLPGADLGPSSIDSLGRWLEPLDMTFGAIRGKRGRAEQFDVITQCGVKTSALTLLPLKSDTEVEFSPFAFLLGMAAFTCTGCCLGLLFIDCGWACTCWMHFKFMQSVETRWIFFYGSLIIYFNQLCANMWITAWLLWQAWGTVALPWFFTQRHPNKSRQSFLPQCLALSTKTS